MKIDAVDFFYLSMPEVTTEADGSQDALLVRVAAGGLVGFGECEAAPLPSIAAFVCPMSHGACQPVSASVLGRVINGPQDIAAIAADVAYNSMDVLQAAHTWSGIEMALWDLLGKARGDASLLFGDSAQETLARGQDALRRGFKAAKFGWGPIGRGTPAQDADHFFAAREALGPDGILLVDVGQIFGEDLARASARLGALEQARALWLEEPFNAHALQQYGELAKRCTKLKLAGGEGAHNAAMAEHLIDYGGIGFVQIDCGRIGGIGPAKQVADYAAARGVTYVNHTFTSHLALSASLQPYAGLAEYTICEYPAAPKALAVAMTQNHLTPDAMGLVRAPA
ncbi:MAG: mandelate racemase/muconate lactonizing enzyme family protein, partial [Betaproteobacteria bacterium]|nr:mandelate racemase/muconate lactonizing enzyme family protein [Betaproteobacteria bacterium]